MITSPETGSHSKRLVRTRSERASLLSCEGGPLNRSVDGYSVITKVGLNKEDRT